jgi:hypothetical protein
MKGDAQACEWFESRSYVGLGSTCDTDVQIWETQVNKILYELEDFLSWGWKTRVIWTLIECVHEKVDGALRCE